MKKNSNLAAFMISLLIILITSCQKEIQQEQTSIFGEQATTIASQNLVSIPDKITITQPGLYPEGIAFDKFNDRFLVSSFGQGTIGAVSFDGNYTPLIQDPDLKSTLGLHI